MTPYYHHFQLTIALNYFNFKNEFLSLLFPFYIRRVLLLKIRAKINKNIHVISGKSMHKGVDEILTCFTHLMGHFNVFLTFVIAFKSCTRVSFMMYVWCMFMMYVWERICDILFFSFSVPKFTCCVAIKDNKKKKVWKISKVRVFFTKQ